MLRAIGVVSVLAVIGGTWLVLASEPQGQTLADAVELGDSDLARRLLESGADPEEPRVFNLTPLMRAAVRDDSAMVKILLAAGADLAAVGDSGLTALQVAAQRDALGAFTTLLESGGELSYRSANGMNALEHAADWGSREVLGELARLGVDLDARSEVVTQGHGHPRDEGPTPLAIAVRAGRLAAVELLLDVGASVDTVSRSGHTPLLIAVFSSQPPEMVELLLEHGADLTVRAGCGSGCSPGELGDLDALGWAKRLERADLIPLLEAAISAGSDPG